LDIEVYIEVCREGVVLPSYARPGDAGMDVCAAEEVVLRPGQTVLVPTGLKMAIPEGYEIQIRPRSGISLKTPIRVSNSPGTIDSGYRDELCIILTNTSVSMEGSNSGASADSAAADSEAGCLNIDSKGNLNGTYIIKNGDRIAQMVLQEIPRMKLVTVDSIEGIGTNRGGGFGSTGVKTTL
jgi:dUTP pyrophosphatase